MKIKTYGVYGLSEWHIIIDVAKRKLSIPFMGGVSKGSGVVPATYTTNNPVVQYGIEESVYFKSGRISIVKELVVEDPEPVLGAEEVGSVDLGEESEEGSSEVGGDSTEVRELDGSGVGDLQHVHVDSMREAIDYLEEHYPEAMSGVKLLRKKDVSSFASTVGISFEGWDKH